MGERTLNAAATLGLLLAVLAVVKAPHFHPFDTRGAATVESTMPDGSQTARLLDPAECVVCRSGHSSRVGIAPGSALTLSMPSDDPGLRLPNEVQVVAARSVASTAPPRAPPV